MAKKKETVARHRDPYTPYTHSETIVTGPGAKQSMKAECDINNIVAKYEKTGVLTHLNASQATYADVSELTGYRDALDKVIAAEELFMALPSEVRAKFHNDAALYLDFVGSASEADLNELSSKVYGNKSGQISPDPEPVQAQKNSAEEESG